MSPMKLAPGDFEEVPRPLPPGVEVEPGLACAWWVLRGQSLGPTLRTCSSVELTHRRGRLGGFPREIPLAPGT